MNHTPGPWTAVSHYSDVMTIIDGDGFEVVEAPPTLILLDYAEKLKIEHWAGDPRASRYLTTEEQEANARLIAAAPELYEACRRAQVLLDATMRYMKANPIAAEYTVNYDEADCDGSCLAGDCGIAAEECRDALKKAGAQ